MHKLEVMVFVLFLVKVMSTMSERANNSVEIQTRLGIVRGKKSVFLRQRIWSFLGVPFAEPPIKEQRFKPTRRKEPWHHPFDANKLSPACYQGRDMYNTTFWGSEMWNANTPVSEDCLYLNIWAPADAYDLPVMVWIFGGGYYSGSPSLILYDGSALALAGNVIVVNINYRLGAFGFLYLDNEEIPGNVGLLDQQLALEWIYNNINAFGGNPSRISLIGESAGASSIVAHMISPGSRDLFRNAILQSGSLDNRWAMNSPKRAKHKSIQLIENVNCNRATFELTLKCMRDIPPKLLVEHSWNIGMEFMEFPFVVVSRDRNFFREKDAFISLRNGDYKKDTNMIIGMNSDEGNFWNIYNLPEYFDKGEQPRLSLKEMNDCVDRIFSSQPSLVRDAAKFVYSDPICKPNRTEFRTFYADQVNQMVGDYFFTCDSLWLADEISRHSRVYVYYFAEHSNANPWPQWTGVMHGYEIEFVFGVPLYNYSAGYTKREQIFSDKVIQYWTTFAEHGIPRLHDGKASDFWPQYEESNPRWMILKGGSHMKPISAKKRPECSLWRYAKNLEYQDYVDDIKNTSTRLIYNFMLIFMIILV